MSVTTSLPTKRSTRTTGEMFLRFQLDKQTCAVVPMLQTQEAVIIPAGRVSVIPNLPSCVLGLFNRRSSLLWLVDLPEILGLEPIDRYAHSYDVALLKVGQTPLAVAVRSIQGVVRFNKEEIRSPIGSFNPAFTPYLSGWILQEQELVLVLDPEAIINAKMFGQNG
ncbi:chemotaxis protein CheW [Chamaesiphon minutus]|uniref:Chemotaxis signal transduction protein n=1 Tax=Chamaesiphon minutus (strain ATCC 27169 / PCC 6605) TaxID=1173020 RepID=K9UKJ3_CHAP6|nr:chemotaxis protein CheW [Chamaesiphon minutus]AFY95320.1 chemotaxis signal transduction protein [Chamaesiphon minutus PCC 6605]